MRRILPTSILKDIQAEVNEELSMRQYEDNNKQDEVIKKSKQITQGLIDVLGWNLSQEEFDRAVKYFNTWVRGD